MTDEAERPTEDWVSKHGPEYAHAYDRKGALARFFQIPGYPHAVLVDPLGTIVWRGHPAKLRKETIEAALTGALSVPTWQWGDDAKKILRAYEKREFAKALQEASKLSDEGTRERVTKALEQFVADRLTMIASAREAGDWLRAITLAEQASDWFDDLPAGAEAEAIADELDDDESAQRIAAGQRDLRDLRIAGGEADKRKEVDKLTSKLEKLVEEHPDTIVAEQGRELLEEFRALWVRLGG